MSIAFKTDLFTISANIDLKQKARRRTHEQLWRLAGDENWKLRPKSKRKD